MDPTQIALELAADLGFDLAGVAPLAPPPDAQRFQHWLDEGRHASMDYLERQRERISDPRKIVPGGRSMLVVGLAHSRPEVDAPGGGRIARYAAGRDYHNYMVKRLRRLGRALAREGLVDAQRAIVDAGPVLERSHAEVAGLGFASKAANLLHPQFGPWFFLGELLLDVELDPTPKEYAASCGTCTACLDVCPTGALVAPGELDARTCISYQTIENRGAIPHELREEHGDWAFGCDLCSEVCPHGRKAPDTSGLWGSHPGLQDRPLVTWLDPEGWGDDLQGSPLRRAKREGLARNAAIVLGNRPDIAGEAGRQVLLQALSFDPSPIVREASAWGLARGYGQDRGVRTALSDAVAREPEGESRTGMQRDLELDD